MDHHTFWFAKAILWIKLRNTMESSAVELPQSKPTIDRKKLIINRLGKKSDSAGIVGIIVSLKYDKTGGMGVFKYPDP